MEGTEITITAGTWKGRIYNMTVRPNSKKLEETENVEEKFHVNINIHYREGQEKHEIVRIDNSHDYMHIHKFYSTQEDERETIDMGYWQAMNYLQENLDRFARLYDENHR